METDQNGKPLTYWGGKMIKAEIKALRADELMLNNWVKYKGEPIQVTMIGEFGIQSDDSDMHINAKFATPDLSAIPISESVLLKCGFEKSADNEHWFINHNGWCLWVDISTEKPTLREAEYDIEKYKFVNTTKVHY